MKKVILLLMTITITLSVYESRCLATEWYNPEMLKAFGKPGDTVVAQKWATPEALRAYGKPGDTVGETTIPISHRDHKRYLHHPRFHKAKKC